MAYVISPDGKRGTVPDDQLELALERGYTVDETRAKASEEPLLAFAERALGTLTLGASDEVLAGVYGAPYKDFQGRQQQGGEADTSEQLKARADTNPLASFAGNLTGAVISPAARISGAASSVKGAVALGAVEGSIFGLGSAVTADALGDRQALTEELAARVGAAALTGGVVSGAITGAVRAGTRVATAAEAAELPKRLADFAEQAGAVVRKDRITTDEALEAAGLEWRAVDKWAKKNGIFNRATSPDAMYEQAAAAVRRAESDVGDALLKLDDMAAPDLAALYRKVADLADSPADLLAAPKLAGAARRAARVLGKQADEVPLSSAEPTAVGAMKWADLLEASKAFSATPSRRRLAEAINEEVVQQAFKVDRDLAEQLERGFEGVKVGSFLRSELEALDAPVDLGNAAAAAAPAMVLGGPMAAIKAGGAVIAGQAIRKRAPLVLAKALDTLAEGSAIKPLADSFLVQLKARLNTMPELLGPFRVVLENAAAEGAASALATHVQLAQSELGDEYLATMGFPRDEPGDVAAVGQKVQQLAAMQHVRTSVEVRLGDSLKALDREREDVVASEREFWQAYESVQKLREQPPVDDKLSMFPDVGMSVTAKLSEAAQYVYERAPKPPDSELPPALQRAWEPSPQERTDFMRVAKAALQPLDAIEDVMYGQPAQKTLEALSALYPKLLEQATMRMFERLNQDKPLTIRERQRLEPFIGAEALGLSSVQAQAIAAVHVKSSSPEGEGGPRVDGRQAVNQNQNYATQSQRIEARRSGA